MQQRQFNYSRVLIFISWKFILLYHTWISDLETIHIIYNLMKTICRLQMSEFDSNFINFGRSLTEKLNIFSLQSLWTRNWWLIVFKVRCAQFSWKVPNLDAQKCPQLLSIQLICSCSIHQSLPFAHWWV